jgi:hypothetical protein
VKSPRISLGAAAESAFRTSASFASAALLFAPDEANACDAFAASDASWAQFFVEAKVTFEDELADDPEDELEAELEAELETEAEDFELDVPDEAVVLTADVVAVAAFLPPHPDTTSTAASPSTITFTRIPSSRWMSTEPTPLSRA